MTCKKKRKKTNKREPHPEVGGHVLPFQFPHGQIVMALLCEEILWNFTSKIWWFPYSIVHTMIIWKCSKVLVVPPKKTLTRLYFQKYLLIMKTTIATSRKAIQLDGNYLKKKFCSKFSWTKSNHTNRNLTPGTAFPYRAFKVFTRGYSYWICPSWKWITVLLRTRPPRNLLTFTCKGEEGEEIVIFPLSHSKI